MISRTFKLLKKPFFHQKLFYLLILFLPLQLGRHFWPEWSYVYGLKIDYLSPTIFLTDLIILALLGFWGLEKLLKQPLKQPFKQPLKQPFKQFFKVRKQKIKVKNLVFPLAIFLFLLINVFFAQNQPAAFFRLLKIVQLCLLGVYVAKNHYRLADLRLIFSLTIIYSSFLAFGQLLKQGSLNGFFWWLGERTFSVATPGIARAVVAGQLWLRPYATFPHPNVLAGFVLVALVLTHESDQIKLTGRKILGYLSLISGVLVLALSFSRSAWLVGFLSGLVLNFHFLKNLKKKKVKKLFWALSLFGWFCLFSLVVFFLSQLSFKQALGERVELMQAAGAMIKGNFLTGVGLNNFIVQLPFFWQSPGLVYWLQPVHNLFCLILTEIGLIGLGAFLWFLTLSFKRLLRFKSPDRLSLIISLGAVLGLGLFDHYWLTLQQTQILLAVVFGLSWGLPKVK